MLKNLVSRFRLAEGASSGYNGAGNGYLAPSYQTSASPVYESTPSFEAADDYNDSYSDRESVPGMDMNSKY